MAAQRGRDLLVKIADENGDYKTIIGLRAKTLNLNAKAVDVTHSQSENAWRELLPGAGIKTLEISGNGIFQDSDSDAQMRAAFFSQAIQFLEVIIPNFGIIQGGFILTELSYAGRYDGETNYEMQLSSASEQTFTPL